LNLMMNLHNKIAAAKETSWTTIALGSRLAFQALYYVMLARALGAQGLGIFASALALVNVFVPFSGLGGGNLIVKYVARDRSALGYYFSHAVRTLLITGLMLLCLSVALHRVALGPSVGWELVALVGVAELLVLRYVETIVQTLQAVDRLDLMARVQFLIGAIRLLSVVVCLCIARHPSVITFALCYFGAGFVNAVLSRAMLKKLVGTLKPTTETNSALGRRLFEGTPFAVGVASKSIYTDIDKTMLTRMVSADVTGVYTIATRLITVGFTPIQAAIMSSNTRLFKKGAHGLLPALDLAKRMLPFLLCYAVAVGIGLYLIAPLLPALLGPSFAKSVSIVRCLTFLPIIQTIHFLLGDTLMGADLQGLRSACQLFVAGINVGLNLWLIPLLGWHGAIIATFSTEGTLAVFMIILVIWYGRKELRRVAANRTNLPEVELNAINMEIA